MRAKGRSSFGTQHDRSRGLGGISCVLLEAFWSVVFHSVWKLVAWDVDCVPGLDKVTNPHMTFIARIFSEMKSLVRPTVQIR